MLASRVLRPGARQLNTILPRSRQFSSISVGNNLSKRPRLPQINTIAAVRLKSSWNPFSWNSSNPQPESAKSGIINDTPANSLETLEPVPTPSIEIPPSSSTPIFEPLPTDDPIEVSNVYERLSGLAVSNTEPYIGFLGDAGLKFGWGPTSSIQWLVEHIHVYTGLPWWGTVLIAATVIRITLLYPSIVASDQQARFTTVVPVMQQMQQELRDEMQNNPQFSENPVLAQAKFQQSMSRVKQAVGLSMTKLFLPIAIQLPLGIGTFRFLTGLSTTPGIGMTTEGLGWFKDLTLADPYYVLPAVMSASLYMFMRYGMKDAPNVAAQQQSIRTAMLYGFPIVTFFVMTWQPAIIQLTFAFTSLILGLQNLVLRNSWVRKKLGIAPLTGASATETLAAFRRPTATTGDAKKSTTSSPDEIRQKKAKQYELIRKRQRQSINDNDTRY